MIKSSIQPQSPWFTHYGYSPHGNMRVFAFPYSGAGVSAYHQWANAFHQQKIDFIGVQPPGRESRLREAPIQDLSLMVKHLVLAIKPLTDKPFVFFGHSLGALIAFELARALRKYKLPLPSHLFVSAFRSPELPNPNKALHQLDDEAFIAGIREYDNTPEDVLANQALMQMLLPMIRADFRMHENYQHRQEPPLPCSITVFKGSYDRFSRKEQMSSWQQHTIADFNEITYQGGHFFLSEHSDSMSKEIINAFTRMNNNSIEHRQWGM
jgi:medium-chain acyl-[acyl-carrier-protein] hydrolase